MNIRLFKNLNQEDLPSEGSFGKAGQAENPLLCVFWELNTLLGLGVISLSTGLGILVYKNIDTIGHQAILTLIAGISLTCFIYCFRKKSPFSRFDVPSSGRIFDYTLLLGTLLMLTFIAYLQFQYQVFGTRYGLATFIPMVALFFIAYNFDHLAILNMAIINLGLWLGVSIAPKQLLDNSNFDNDIIIYTYHILGLFLLIVAMFTSFKRFKPRFTFSYQHYGMHLTFVSAIAAYANCYDQNNSWLWLLEIGVLALFLYQHTIKQKSFYFMLLALIYGYIALSCLACRLVNAIDGQNSMVYILYFMSSAAAFGLLLSSSNKKIKNT